MREAVVMTRQELYDRLWSEPTRTVAASIGVSDVAVAKVCRRADIPIPERGYWARKQANKPVEQRPLPPRFPGASDFIRFGGQSWSDRRPKVDFSQPIPPPPEFPEPMESVADRARKLVGAVRLVDPLVRAHPLISVLLEQDARRREDQRTKGYSWRQPVYDRPPGKRWLHILNSLFLALTGLGCKASTTRSEYADLDRDINVTIGSEHHWLKLSPITEGSDRKKTGRLKLVLQSGSTGYGKPDEIAAWEDSSRKLLESMLTGILVDLLVRAEADYRQGELRHNKWLIEHQKYLIEQARLEKLERERKKRERLAREAKDRIERLIAQAAALDQATTIRRYVERVVELGSRGGGSAEDIDTWAKWALGEADRIDPVLNGTVLKGIEALARQPDDHCGDDDC
jgi:hypothetical protein